jgi:hypothetical protein
MSIVDYFFLGAAVVVFALLMVWSKSARLIVSQCIFHPTQEGYLAFWDDDVQYFSGRPPEAWLAASATISDFKEAISQPSTATEQRPLTVRPPDVPVSS